MTPREHLDGMMGDLRGEMDRLRAALEAKEKENADLKADLEEKIGVVRRLDMDKTRLSSQLETRWRLRREINDALGISEDMNNEEALSAGLKTISDLKARLEEVIETIRTAKAYADHALHGTNGIDVGDIHAAMCEAEELTSTLGASERLRDRVMRECEEIAKPNTGYNALDPFDRGHAHGQNFAAHKIARAREEGK